MKDMSRKAIRRREFIKLASSLLAFPIGGYAGLSRAQNNGSQRPLRILTLPESYGLDAEKRGTTFIRSSTGDYALSASDLGTTLEPLSGYVDQMCVVSNLLHPRWSGVGGNNGHDSVNCHVLTGSKYIDNGSHATATSHNESLDILIANYLSQEGILPNSRLYPHLFFANGARRARQTVCYDTSGTQIRAFAGVQSIMDTVIGNLSSNANTSIENARLSTQQDILNLVSRKVVTVKERLANENFNTKLDAFNTGVIELADQIEERTKAICDVPSETSAITQNTTENIFKLIAQTFACDAVTSLTYMIGDELINDMSHTHLQSDQEDAEVNAGLATAMHNVSHDSEEYSDRVHELVRRDQAVHIAGLLDVLSTTPEIGGDGMMLDNTIVFMPSILGQNTHLFGNMPMVVIAGQNTNIIGGRHYDCDGKTNNDLLTTVAQGLYIPLERQGGFNDTGYVNSSNTGVIDKMLKTRIA